MAKTYTSKNQDKIDQLAKEYVNREKFSYDPSSDEAYQNYAKLARQEGAKAMEDTMGRAASMTGGYGNSYGATAGGQVYRDYLRDIDAKADEYYAMALDKYNAEGNDILSRLNVAQQKESTERAAWESEYQREWDAAIQGAAYGNTDALAGLLGMDNTQLRSAMGIGALSDAQIEGFKNAVMNGKGQEYLNSLTTLGYNIGELPILAQQWAATGELGGTVNFGYKKDKDGKDTTEIESIDYTPDADPKPEAYDEITFAPISQIEIPSWEGSNDATTGDFFTIKVKETDKDGEEKVTNYDLEMAEELDKEEYPELYDAVKYFRDEKDTPGKQDPPVVFNYDGATYVMLQGKIFGVRNNFWSMFTNNPLAIYNKINHIA